VNELEDLDAEIRLLTNAETIKQQLAVVYAQLKDGEEPLVQQLRSMQQKLLSLKDYHSSLEKS
jgi:DNA repair protein RecN (Recombination protein N)